MRCNSQLKDIEGVKVVVKLYLDTFDYDDGLIKEVLTKHKLNLKDLWFLYRKSDQYDLYNICILKWMLNVKC